METYFATPQRSDQSELYRQIESAANNSIIDGILCLASGIVAIMNQHRQILSVNHRLLEQMGVANANEILGLRLGEALGCVFSDKTAAGCGTSPYCVTCGAAIAIVSTLGTHGPVERACSITVEKQGRRVDFYFNVRAATLKIQHERFVLIFLNDITQQQHQATLEYAFFHDIKNMIKGLVDTSRQLSMGSSGDTSDLVNQLVSLSNRLSKEVELQHHLSKNEGTPIGICYETLKIDDIIKEMKKAVFHHPCKNAKRLIISNHASGTTLTTDLSLLLRVLANMLINAFEADDSDHEVCLDIECQADDVIFSVWNKGGIAVFDTRRIFHRNFSTKGAIGRGLGTYSMKFIGEQLLGGRVFFTSSLKQGTRFFIALAKNSSQQNDTDNRPSVRYETPVG